MRGDGFAGTMAVMIEVRSLTKRYGEVTAVDGLTFAVRPGLVTGFLGPNGAGKSTTMRVALGLDRPTSGDVLIDGRRYRQWREPLRRIGAVLETNVAHAGRTAYHHLLYLAQSNRIGNRRVREVIELVGLGGAARRRVRGFSLGMRQRLGIAAALLGDPAVLVLDEPVNGLDPEGVRWLRTLLKHLAAEGRTVFVSSHLMSEMAITADHLIVIGRSRMLADASLSDFIARYARPSVRIRTPEPARMQETLVRAGVSVEQAPDGTLLALGEDPSMIGRLASAHGVILDELRSQSDSLEEAFMRLVAPGVRRE
jgi:ABC-2 type transport system ATP-binding protein